MASVFQRLPASTRTGHLLLLLLNPINPPVPFIAKIARGVEECDGLRELEWMFKGKDFVVVIVVFGPVCPTVSRLFVP